MGIIVSRATKEGTQTCDIDNEEFFFWPHQVPSLPWRDKLTYPSTSRNHLGWESADNSISKSTDSSCRSTEPGEMRNATRPEPALLGRQRRHASMDVNEAIASCFTRAGSLRSSAVGPCHISIKRRDDDFFPPSVYTVNHTSHGRRSPSQPIKCPPRRLTHPHEVCPHDVSPMCNSLSSDEADVEYLERLYEQRTWIMYRRITESRTQSLSAPKMIPLVEPPRLDCDYLYNKFSRLDDPMGYDDPDLIEDFSHSGHVMVFGDLE
jgi:hypothetical protein